MHNEFQVFLVVLAHVPPLGFAIALFLNMYHVCFAHTSMSHKRMVPQTPQIRLETPFRFEF